jgi:hypothetical protein
MSNFNPYAPPTTSTQPRDAEFRGADSADLFVEMQPTTQVRAVGIAAILTGIAFAFVTLQFALFAISRRPVVVVVELVVALLAAGYLLVAWGVPRARMGTAIFGLVLSVVAGGTSLVVFFWSGAFSSVLAGAGALVTMILLAVSLGDIGRMARARVAMARLERGG